jgi:hypothetical protein
VTGRLYPDLTSEAVVAREAALERYARWEAGHPALRSAAAAIAGVAALYELLSPESRRRAPDPSGVEAFHELMARAAAVAR